MGFTAHFKYDGEIALWLSSFMARALPGTPLPEDVPYRLSPGEEVPYAESHRLFMTLDVDGGMVDIAVTLVVPCFGPPAGDPPRFEDPEVTWDVQDVDGAHIRTLVWDEAARSWDGLDIPADGPEMEQRDGA